MDPDPNQPRRRIYLFWHEYILCPFYLRGHCNLAMLLSQHDDATILYHAASLMGFDTVRGSSKRGATKALMEMIGKSKEAKHLTITPDGPRGPRRTMAAGAVFLASQLQMPLVLMGFAYDRPWRLSSWDRFAIPRPFSRCRIIFSEEIMIPPDLTKDQIEEYRQKMERILNDLNDEARAWVDSGEKWDGDFIARRSAFGNATFDE